MDLLWQAPPPPIVGSGSGSSLQSPRLTPRRISAAIPLAEELKNKKAPTFAQIAEKPYHGSFQKILNCFSGQR